MFAVSVGDGAQVVATGLVAVSLVFVVLQLRLTARTLKDAAWVSLTDKNMQLTRLFIDEPGLRRYFYRQAPVATEDEDLKIECCAEMMCDFIDCGLTLSKSGSKAAMQDFENWLAFFQDMVATSPVLANFARRHANWYSEQFSRVLLERPGESRPSSVVVPASGR